MADSVLITNNVTKAELDALIENEALEAGLNYMITDRGDRGLLFKAASKTQLETDGTRYMLCPADYAIETDSNGNVWKGVWNSVKTFDENDLTIWNGLVWKAKGAVLAAQDSPDNNETDWELIQKASFANNEYVELIFGVRYDVANDWISLQWDNNGNIIGIGYLTEDNWGFGFNMCDYTDWNISTSGAYFYDNRAYGIYNNISSGIYSNTVQNKISGNNCLGEIYGNIIGYDLCDNICTQISNNYCTGRIKNNSCAGIAGNISINIQNNILANGSITFNKNNGSIQNNINNGTGSIINNTNNGNITGTWDADVSDVVVNKTGTA